jgi:hypothetical protein
MTEVKRPLKVFLCHASTDKPKVRELYRYLRRRGINPWFDEEDLVGGQDWQVEIPKALATSDAIIICLTKNSVDKEGYIQKEIKFALDKALEMPEGRIFLIPVKFEECEVPFTLSRYQWVDLTVESGYAKMMKALKFRASQLERSTVAVSRKNIEEEKLAQKEAAEKARLEAEELARQKAAKDKAERESAEKAARERAEKESAEKARLEAEEQAKIKAAKEKAEHEAAEQVAREKAERETAERLAKEKIAREKAEKETAEKARLEAEERARRKSPHKKASQESAETPKPKVVKPESIEEKPSQVTTEKANSLKKLVTQSQQVKNKTNSTVAFGFIGLVIVALGVLAINNRSNSPSFVSTSTSSFTSSVPTSVEKTKTSTPNPLSYETPLPSITPITNVEENKSFNMAYISGQDGNNHLFYLEANGKKNKLLDGYNFDFIDGPVISHNGKFIVFATQNGIYTVEIGTDSVRRNADQGQRPRWSRDNQNIAFETSGTFERPGCIAPDGTVYKNCTDLTLGTPFTEVLSEQRIFIISANQEIILAYGGSAINNTAYRGLRGILLPKWSFDGRKFSYISRQNVDFLCIDDYPREYYVDPNCYQLNGTVNSYDWSHNNDRIAVSSLYKGKNDIYLLDIESSNIINVTDGEGDNISPVWNHAGDKIAFVSNRDGNNDIYLMTATGTIIKNLTQNISSDFSPIWTPDDKAIVFVSNRSGNLDIFLIDVENGDIINLTNDPADEFSPTIIEANP